MDQEIINYKINHIPTNTKSERRPCIKMDAEYITIHSTANLNSTAQNERDWLVNQSNNHTASWHICVDQNEAIEAIPVDEVAWHAGDGNGNGNMKSISIEICESGDRQKTLDNAIKLIVSILHKRNWGIEKIKKHQDWSGKYCPRILIPEWDKFIERIQNELDKYKICKTKIKKEKIPQWKYAGVHYLNDKKMLDDIEYWKDHINEPMPVWAVTILISKIFQDINSLYNAI